MVTQHLADVLHREGPNQNGSNNHDVACLYNEGLHISVVLLGPAPEVEIVQQKVSMPHTHDGGFGNYHALAR